MIAPGTIEKIRDAARIQDIVGDFVSLRPRGASLVACCPFHNEKTPSFYVTPSKGIFKCFGCGEVGDSIGFLMKHENMSYTEALKYIAAKYGIEVVEKELSAEELASKQRMESIHIVSEFAQNFYEKRLWEGEGRTLGYQYLKSRGVQDDTIKTFGIGWAPSGRSELVDAARAAGFKDEYLIAAGLCKVYDDGRIQDKFRERVMFPIHSVSGRVIAYSGRTLKSDENIAKYMNSPDSELYSKSHSLFGIYLAKGAIAREKKCILVEGNVDVVSMHQLGLKNVVASCGTALTAEQVRLIRRFTEDVTIMYDGDKAGIKAALKGLGLVLAEGLNVRVVLLPEGQDPDDFARKHTLDEVKDFIAKNERDFISFKTDLLLEEASGDPLKRAALINDLADTIAMVPDPVKRTVYVQDCAVRFDVDQQILLSRVNNVRLKMRDEEFKQKQREERLSEQLPEVIVEQPVSVEAGDPLLSPRERNLLQYVLRYGLEKMLFDKDSEYYNEDPLTVFEFIDSVLQDDGAMFSDEGMRKTYDEYGRLYDEGLSQEEIQARLIASEDRNMARLVSDLVVEKYDLSVEDFRSTLTKTSTAIVKYIPEELMRYQLARIDKRQKECKELLKTASGEAQMDLLMEMTRNNKIRNSISVKLNNAR